MSERLRVALLDDSEDLRSAALGALTDAGIDALVAERESVDLNEVAEWRPDVLIVDPQGMPGASRHPFDVALAVRDHPLLTEVPIVLLSAPWTLWQSESEVQLVKPAVTLNKPFSLAELIEAVRRAGLGGRGTAPNGIAM